jgi:hypothetical protein
MKRKSFTNASNLIMSALLLTCAFTSCTKKSSQLKLASSTDEIISAKPNSPQEIHLKMTVNNSGNNITSDNLGDYVNGSQNVSLYFSTSGNLQFNNSASPSKPTSRWLNVNLNYPLDGYSQRGTLQSGFISTITTLTSPNPTLIQNLNVGDTKCIGFSAGVPDGVINFHRNTYEDTPTSQSSYVYVTRTSATIWIMTPVPPVSGGCSTLSSIAAFRSGATLFGYYNVPFSFTFTQIP